MQRAWISYLDFPQTYKLEFGHIWVFGLRHALLNSGLLADLTLHYAKS
jgi:hypothetical protein